MPDQGTSVTMIALFFQALFDVSKIRRKSFYWLRAINSLILDTVSVFEMNYDKLMEGTLEQDLMA
ncbi:hypothetical protein [Nitrosomonas sp. Is37]|uniref:hypothetical protein n=1 Tax=Nitrosomonas sp. Is37 TaxID=3080535 RepID=UPI00294AFAD8|nr:hypothetical protein [Nitrosomonas sp. Is37]MDV6343764.1 hypothetical protein [Nitrosomonas sp. Is37]